MYRKKGKAIEVFLAHPGGPFWSKKDVGAWTIPKGEFEAGEDPLAAAVREFREETGFGADGEFVELGTVKQKSGKVVYAWAMEGDRDASALVSNTCEIEWPPRSGRKITIPEVDRGGWFTLSEARAKIMTSQIPFLEALTKILAE